MNRNEKRKYKILNDRFYALVIDGLIFAIPLILLEGFILNPNISSSIVLSNIFFYYFVTHFYSIYLHTIYGQTLGKMAVGIKVLNISEENINLKQAILRELPFIVFSLFTMASEIYQILSIGITEHFRGTFFDNLILIILLVWMVVELIVALSNEKRRSIHDFISGTIVVKL